MYRLIFFFLFLSAGAWCPVIAAQQSAADTSLAKAAVLPDQKKAVLWSPKSDSSPLQLRRFDKQRLQEYSRQEAFDYGQGTLLQQDLWTQFWRWFWSLYNGLLRDSEAGQWFIYAFILLFVAFAAYGIAKFSGVDLRFLSSRSKTLDVPYTETMDNIHEIDFGSQIDAAIASGNLRLAVRLYYLRTLKVLSDRNLISWQPEKTNSTYVNEIADLPVRQQFAHLTRNFEYVWYGEFDINRDTFDVLRKRFDQFNKQA